MRFADVASTWRSVAATTSRRAKTGLVAEAIRTAAFGDKNDVAVVVTWLSGELTQRRSGVGWATIRETPPPAIMPALSVAEVDNAFERASALSGPGSVDLRRAEMHELFGGATADEQAFLRGLISGDLRQGALDAVVIDGLAQASGLPVLGVRRAVMLAGATAPVAAAVMQSGAAGLSGFGLKVGRPIQPMLAASAPTVAAALEQHDGDVSVETKLDGIRAQVHRDGEDISVFSRSLDDITARVREIVDTVRALPSGTFILDAEALALHHETGRPLPFQETGARAATRIKPARVPLSLAAFDLLHLDGDDLIDQPLEQRRSALTSLAPDLAVDRVVVRAGDAARDAAEEFFATTLADGHEGVVVKSLGSTYDAGRRGSAWLKVKPVRTVDLVILAAEWGHGRRAGWLSNLHLGARDPVDGWVMVGRTFKGMTDQMLRWQTAQLQAIAIRSDEWTVHVTPSLVVEIGFDGVQRSTRYPGGVALRFARVLRYRDDKTAAEADSIRVLQAMLST